MTALLASVLQTQLSCCKRLSWFHGICWSICLYRCTYLKLPLYFCFVAQKILLMLAHFVLGHIHPLWWDDKESAHLLSHDIVAVHSFTPWNSVIAHARRWRVHKPSISALKKLAVDDLSQNDPVSRKPVFPRCLRKVPPAHPCSVGVVQKFGW